MGHFVRFRRVALFSVFLISCAAVALAQVPLPPVPEALTLTCQCDYQFAVGRCARCQRHGPVGASRVLGARALVRQLRFAVRHDFAGLRPQSVERCDRDGNSSDGDQPAGERGARAGLIVAARPWSGVCRWPALHSLWTAVPPSAIGFFRWTRALGGLQIKQREQARMSPFGLHLCLLAQPVARSLKSLREQLTANFRRSSILPYHRVSKLRF